jgi:urea ABC transporter ATP-binding protein UrtD
VQPLLEIRDVSKSFGGVMALNHLTLAMAEGELACIIGPNGCGKTTLFNVITGAFPPSSGEVRFAGERVTGLRRHEIARRGILRKFQVPGIYPTLTVLENLEVPLASTAGRRGPLALVGRRAVTHDLDELLERFNLTAEAGQLAGALAHGKKQWLEIAMLLAGEARLLLLDEPTAGMTGPEVAATAQLIARLQRERGMSVLVIEHNMHFVQQLGCRVMVMMRGAVFCEGTYEEVQRNPAVREGYLGRAAAC